IREYEWNLDGVVISGMTAKGIEVTLPETNQSKRKNVFSVVAIDIAGVRSDPQSRDVTNVPVLDTSK
ncbi:hypothetical protein NAI47_09995, partial [Francisella tularensis subsp. holarctica]|nr:hypothetical protein [Francisella tularensis subsp. holarctica]